MSEETDLMAGYVDSLSEAQPEQAHSPAEAVPAPELVAEKFAVTSTKIVEQVRAFAQGESERPGQEASLSLPDWDVQKLASGFTEDDINVITPAEKRGLQLVQNSKFAAEIVHHLFNLKEAAGDNPNVSLLVDYTLAGLTRSKADMDALVPPEQFAELMSASLGEFISGYKELDPDGQDQVAALYQNLLGNLSRYREKAIDLYDAKAPEGQKFKDIEDEFIKLTIVLQYDALQRTFDATDAGVDAALRIQANKNSHQESSSDQAKDGKEAKQMTARELYERAKRFMNSTGESEQANAASDAVQRGGDFLVSWAVMMFDSHSGIHTHETHASHEISKDVAIKLINHWKEGNNFHDLIKELNKKGVISSEETSEAIKELEEKTKDPVKKEIIDAALAEIHNGSESHLLPHDVKVEDIVFAEWFCHELRHTFAGGEHGVAEAPPAAAQPESAHH